jgi:sigma-B regulation protein RsbU (phosphoserine phosphatase)
MSDIADDVPIMAQRLSAQRAFLADLRHELRTPLNAVIGYSEMLIEDVQDLEEEDGRAAMIRDLEMVRAAGTHLLALINDILDPAQVATTQGVLDLEALGTQLRQELDDPLNSIIGYSAIWVEDAQQRGWADLVLDLQKIHAAGQCLLQLIDGIAAVHRVQADTASAEPRPLQDPMAVVRAAASEAAAHGCLLVVDDNETNRDLLARRLERQGYRVVLAESGRQALEILKQHSFDLVLLDIQMPEMNGYEVCQQLKADEGTRDMPIIFISALGDIQDKIQAFTAGGVDYVTKPFQFQEVLARVETHLALRRLQRQLEDANQQLQDANHKMARELALAGEVQASFLPQELPHVPGWQLAVSLRPSRETSGDFYDVEWLPNGRLGILIGDVVDKGAGAALFMALSWILIRTYATQYPAQPELILSSVNRRILEDTAAQDFVTVFYGVLDPGTGELVYANAGHCPALVVRAREQGAVQALCNTGMPLGLFQDVIWRQGVVQLAPGDVLVLYTDGITEARDAQREFFDEDRLRESLIANRGQPAETIRDAILGAVDEFVGDAPQSDDIGLVVVARGGYEL